VPESTIENCQAISIVSISILTHPYEPYIFILSLPLPFTNSHLLLENHLRHHAEPIVNSPFKTSSRLLR
jgi:hypothetical protein